MPETESLVGGTEEVTVVSEFYRAVGGRDGAAVGKLVRDRFAPDATVIWPESLPHGGTLAGSDAIATAFSRSAAAAAGPGALRVVELIGDGPTVAARVAFDWTVGRGGPTIATEALELWTFRDGAVAEIRAFYWDTHACITRPS